MKSRTGDRDLQLNIVIGIASQIILIVTNLVSKKAIQWSLGLEYLGIQTVFSNIGDLLTFAFSGIGVGVLYSFIRPIEKKDSEKIQSLYFFYNKIYRIMTRISVILGIAVTVTLPFVIDADVKIVRVVISYWLYLLGIIIYNRYLIFHYILIAYQKRYMVCLLSGIVEISILVAEVILLVMTGQYEVFLICFIAKNIFINGSIFWYLNKKYAIFFSTEKSQRIGAN